MSYQMEGNTTAATMAALLEYIAENGFWHGKSDTNFDE